MRDRTPYRIQALDDKFADTSGSWLANHGLHLKLGGDFDSTSVLLRELSRTIADCAERT